MIAFKEFVNEVKISKGLGMKYLGLIKKGLKSKSMDISTDGPTMTVKYDSLSLIFKDLYLVGFEEEGTIYSVSKSVKSIKDLKNIKEFQKAFGAEVNAVSNLSTPVEPVQAYFPKDNKELKELIKNLIKERGNDADLNDINVSGITNMEEMFGGSKFNGDISKWDTSGVKDMSFMFSDSEFNGDVSKWNTGSVIKMNSTFYGSKFNGDVSKWNTGSVIRMNTMFGNSPLEGDEPSWYSE